ncbi:MAG: amidohydrolase family protein [Bifidobacteriaceae bacterium]|jgi:predicted TIM-barrel fold metal-dependent hydrolase|nr:amidohydrolase family protein [Bifidobacteriaceae bacterium]
MIVDALAYVGTSRFGYALMPDDVLSGLDKVGAHAAVVAPMHPIAGPMARANAGLLYAAGEADGRLVPLARIDPWDPDAPEQLAQCAEKGARGLLLHPWEEHFRANDRALVRPLVRAAAALRLPVTVVAGYHLISEPLQLAELAGWVPEVPVVLTNGGQLNISGLALIDAKLALRDHPNLKVHTTGQYRQDFLEDVVADYGQDRLLYASAAPCFDMAQERARVGLAHFSQVQAAAVLGNNARAVYGF